MFPLQLDDPRVEAFFETSAVPKIMYQALLEAIDCSFVIVDRNYRLGTIVLKDAEPSYLHMEKTCYEAVFNSDRPCMDCPVTVLFDEGRLTTGKTCLSLPDEVETWWFEVRAYPLFDKQYNVAHAIIAFRLMRGSRIDSNTSSKMTNEQQRLLKESGELPKYQGFLDKYQGFLDKEVGRQPLMSLSKRETEILRLMADGMTNSEIATTLFISPNTVKCHTVHIFNKLGVNNRTQASIQFAEA